MALRQAGGYGGRGSFRMTWNRQVGATLQAGAERAAEATGRAAVARARELVRVDTGELRDSIRAEVRRTQRGVALALIADAEHAIYNELGTSRMSAQPFIRPAMDAEGPRLGERLRAEVGRGR